MVKLGRGGGVWMVIHCGWYRTVCSQVVLQIHIYWENCSLLFKSLTFLLLPPGWWIQTHLFSVLEQKLTCAYKMLQSNTNSAHTRTSQGLPSHRQHITMNPINSSPKSRHTTVVKLHHQNRTYHKQSFSWTPIYVTATTNINKTFWLNLVTSSIWGRHIPEDQFFTKIILFIAT